MAAYQQQMRKAGRQRQLAQALQQQAQAAGQVQSGGRFLVGPSKTSALAGLASALGGAFLDRRADRMETEAEDSERKRLTEAYSQLRRGGAQQGPPGMITETGAMGTEDAQQRAAAELLSGLPIEMQQRALGGQALKSMFPPTKQATQPSSVLEYEYARKNGFDGSFQDWVVAGGQSSRPSAVQEWEFYSQLPQEMQQRYLEMKRNPNMIVRDVNQVPTVIHPTVSGTSAQPLSTQQSENDAANERKRQEAEGTALGKAQGEIAGGIQTKGANAENVTGLIDEATPLIAQATGSAGGALIDAGAGVVGYGTEGAKAIARLKVVSAALIQNMPRLEGPQSDADRQLYIEAAGQIGDPTVPREIKAAALNTVSSIQDKYKQRAAGAGAPPATGVPSPAGSPARISSDADYDTLPSGTEFVAPDGSRRRKP